MPDESESQPEVKTEPIVPAVDELKPVPPADQLPTPPESANDRPAISGSSSSEPSAPPTAEAVPPGVSNQAPASSQPSQSNLSSASDKPGNTGDLTPEQQKFIHHWSFGPFLTSGYFWAMDAWKVGVIFILIEFVGTYVGYFAVSLIAAFVFKALNVFGGTGAPFFILMFGTGAVAAVIWMIGLTIWAMRKGRSIAWTHRQWVSYDNFVSVQKKWDLAGKIFLILTLVWLGLWAAITLPGLLLLSTNPSQRLAQAQDAATKSTMQQIAAAMEACYTANGGTYAPCNSVAKLQNQNFLRQTDSVFGSAATIDVSQDGRSAMVSAKLSDSAVCETGSGSFKYIVYRTMTSKTQVECGSMEPMLSGSSMPGMDMSSTPTPMKSSNMLY